MNCHIKKSLNFNIFDIPWESLELREWNNLYEIIYELGPERNDKET